MSKRDLIGAAIAIFLCVVFLAFLVSGGLKRDHEKYSQKCQQVYSIATTHADTVKLLSSDHWGSCPYYIPEIAQHDSK